MKVNRYLYNWTQSSFSVISEIGYVNTELELILDKIEFEIANLFSLKQQDKLGIKSLGNEIRKSEVLNSIFFYTDDNITCFKMTENKRAFMHQLIDYLTRSHKENLRIYILERNFGMVSNLVDSSFLTIEDADKQLTKISAIFQPRFSNIQIEIIEMYAFKNYNIWSDGNYSKIFLV